MKGPCEKKRNPMKLPKKKGRRAIEMKELFVRTFKLS